MKQFNKLIEFRQAVYEHGFTKAQDAQFELVDALLLDFIHLPLLDKQEEAG